MFVLSIVLLVLAVLGYIIEVITYKVMTKCLSKQQEGKSYVKIIAETNLQGWVQNKDLTALQNNIRGKEDHIRVESKGEIELIQVRSIKQVLRIKSIVSIIVGNL